MEYDLWFVVFIVFAFWFTFRLGVEYGRDKQRRADALYERLTQEKDPEKRRQLALQWNDLVGGRLKKAFRDALLTGKKDKA